MAAPQVVILVETQALRSGERFLVVSDALIDDCTLAARIHVLVEISGWAESCLAVYGPL
ncbi:MAG: hypothetical protein H6937_05150 [Burkholderiales bacterium]|nr:hypothetical protein [Burkholderiales bacterium]